MQPERDSDPLVKEVNGAMLEFEERIFGMTLTQLLTDVGAGVGILALTGGLHSLGARLAVFLLLALPVFILVHGTHAGRSYLHWLYLFARFLTVPRRTSWQAPEALSSRRRRAEPPVQTTWIPFDSLEGGFAGYSEPGGKGNRGRYWVVFEVQGRTVSFLPQADQVRFFDRFEAFLNGLEFRLQFVTQVNPVDREHDPSLVEQRQALPRLRRLFPRLAALLRASLTHQESQAGTCTTARHFVVVSASAREEAFRQHNQDGQGGVISTLRRILWRGEQAHVPPEQVLSVLRTRCTVIRQLFRQLDVRGWLLDDPQLLSVFAACLSPGAPVPSFRPRLEADQPSAPRPGEDGTALPVPALRTRPAAQNAQTSQRRRYRKSVRGLHCTVAYSSPRADAGLSAVPAARLADLLAPTRIEVHPRYVVSQVGQQQRYHRSLLVRDFGETLPCGWMGELESLGLPMLISTTFDPIPSNWMLKRLESKRVQVESQKLSDQKTVRVTRARHTAYAERVQKLCLMLARRLTKVCAVSMTITVHAGSLPRLEERTRYLQAHLRQQRLRASSATYQHDQAWQASLPTCSPATFDAPINLTSQACSTMLNCGSGVIGTRRGAFLGWSGEGLARRPVTLNPWDLPNPHLAIMGETGQGKSMLCKVIVSGLIGQGIADVVVLDYGDDYLRWHAFNQGESQRYDLARHCPLNFLDIPFGPDDIDRDDPHDRLAEFFDSDLLPAFDMLVNNDGAQLTPGEESYLLSVARPVYARRGITSESIRHDPQCLRGAMPTLADYIACMREQPASNEAMRQSLIERMEKAVYLFSGQTSVAIESPLTIFSIKGLHKKWYPLMTYVVQNFLRRHRALRRDERYLVYVVEEASFMLKHPAGRAYLENMARGGRKEGIAQFTLSQDPLDFLEEGAVVLSNAGTVIYCGMQHNAAERLDLPPELKLIVEDRVQGQVVMRCGNEFAALTIAVNPLHYRVFTTNPQDERRQGREPSWAGTEAEERSA